MPFLPSFEALDHGRIPVTFGTDSWDKHSPLSNNRLQQCSACTWLVLSLLVECNQWLVYKIDKENKKVQSVQKCHLLSHSLPYTLTHSPTHTLTCTIPFFLTRHTLTETHSHSPTHTLTCTIPFFLTRHTLSHWNSLTHSLTHSQCW